MKLSFIVLLFGKKQDHLLAFIYSIFPCVSKKDQEEDRKPRGLSPYLDTFAPLPEPLAPFSRSIHCLI